MTISSIEEAYGVSYVGYYDIPGRDGLNVFYQANPKTELGHSHYMGHLVDHTGQGWVCNAKSIVDAKYNAIWINGKFIVSRYRHDYQCEGNAIIDGGIDYARYNPNHPPTHQMTVQDGHEVFEPLTHY